MVNSLIRSVIAVSLFVLAVWLVATLLGYSIGLWTTLIGSVVLTLLINVIMMGFRRAEA